MVNFVKKLTFGAELTGGQESDHRIKVTLHRIDDVLNGDLDELVEALTTADQAAKLLKMQGE